MGTETEEPVEPLDPVDPEDPVTNFDGADIQLQIFAPDLDSPASSPVELTIGDGVEVDNDLPFTDLAGDRFFV
ncbi:MAG: hypothetical protein QNJ72_04215 [Pleurocapsa sp. MO_226.B13]|nr:hypothetical protein [Pleurocapsa sp. MO_226.B13]